MQALSKYSCGDHATEVTSELCPLSVNIKPPLLLLQTRAVPSADAVAILLPSGDHATETTPPLCPVSVNSVLPLLLLHTRAVPSSDAVAILLPSGDQATD